MSSLKRNRFLIDPCLKVELLTLTDYLELASDTQLMQERKQDA